MSMMVQSGRFSLSVAYRWYRVDITTDNGDAGNVGLDEIYAADTVGGTDLLVKGGASGGSWSASSTFGSFAAANAFNHDQGFSPTGWVNNGGGSAWIRHDASTAKQVTHFGLRTMGTETGRMPSEFKLNYSDDNWATKTTALHVSSISAWTQDLIRLWEVPLVGTHRYWEYEEVVNQGDGYCSLGDCYMIFDNGDMARNSTRNCGARRNSSYAGGYEITDALNRSSSNFWVTSGGPPAWFELVVPSQLAEFGFKCKEVNRMPKDFTIKGWNIANQAWDLLNSYGPQTGWSIGETRMFSI